MPADHNGTAQVNYINAHATSTLVGDIAEVRAVKSAFPDMSKMKINGTKSMIGHCLGAAGGMEAIATLKAIQTGWLHPTLNQVSMLSAHAQDVGASACSKCCAVLFPVCKIKQAIFEMIGFRRFSELTCFSM